MYKKCWCNIKTLTLKVPSTTAADDILIFFCFSKKINLAISCESSANQMNHMKYKDIFFEKRLKCLLQNLLGAFRVNCVSISNFQLVSLRGILSRSVISSCNRWSHGLIKSFFFFFFFVLFQALKQ